MKTTSRKTDNRKIYATKYGRKGLYLESKRAIKIKTTNNTGS